MSQAFLTSLAQDLNTVIAVAKQVNAVLPTHIQTSVEKVMSVLGDVSVDLTKPQSASTVVNEVEVLVKDALPLITDELVKTHVSQVLDLTNNIKASIPKAVSSAFAAYTETKSD